MANNIEVVDLSHDEPVPRTPSNNNQADADYANDLFDSNRKAELERQKSNARGSNNGSSRTQAEIMVGPSSRRGSELMSRFRNPLAMDRSQDHQAQSYSPSVASQRPMSANRTPPSSAKSARQQTHNNHHNTFDGNMSAYSNFGEKTPPAKKVRRGHGSNDDTSYNTPVSADGSSLFMTPEPTRAPRTASSLKRPFTDPMINSGTTSPYFNSQTPTHDKQRSNGGFGSQARKIAGGNVYAQAPNVDLSRIEEIYVNLVKLSNTTQTAIEEFNRMESQYAGPMISVLQRLATLEAENRAKDAKLVTMTELVKQCLRGQKRTKTNDNDTPIPGGPYGGPKYPGVPEKGVFHDMLRQHQEGAVLETPRTPASQTSAETLRRRAEGLARLAAEDAADAARYQANREVERGAGGPDDEDGGL
jgi:hypothetical protein